ncbi:MAG: hypothetical protein JSW73_03110 [Candidatus Woesearchaeota archaeon]|nr:MAG: hypothetical protein JSW73_03110 [Candidatus Woesearchaeota archaeon]
MPFGAGGGSNSRKESDSLETFDCRFYNIHNQCPGIKLIKSLGMDLESVKNKYCSQNHVKACPVYKVLEDHRTLSNLEGEILASLSKLRPKKVKVNNTHKYYSEL